MALTTAVYRKIQYRLGELVSDGTDTDELPDELPVTGDITISPVIPGGPELRFTAESPPRKEAIGSFDCTVVNGVLTYRGLPYVWALTTDNALVNPVNWKWRVTHKNMKQGNTPLTFNDFEFQLPAGADPLDLTVATPLAITPTTITIQGPPGDARAVDNGDGSISFLSGAGTGTTGGGGTGSVDTVNGVLPDGVGNVHLTTDNILSGTTTKQFTAGEKTKLAGVEDGANLVTDAELTAAADARISVSQTIVKQSHFLAWGNRPEVWHTGTSWPVDPRPITLPLGTYNGPLVAISEHLPTVTSPPTWLRDNDIWKAAP